MNNNILVVGAGISGATIARLFADNGNKVILLEKEKFIGGNCYDFIDDKGILIHKYGPHIFHTSYDDVWKFVNRFSKFNGYINKVLVSINNKLVEFPINFNSIKKICTKEEFKNFKKDCNNINSETLSIYELIDKLSSESSKKIINFIYKNVYENYTSKMWGIPISDVDKETLKRVKINLNKVWNYFPNDKYQGLPINGYTELIKNIINHENIELKNNEDFFKKIKFKKDKIEYNGKDYTIIYTGEIDSLFNYKFGSLPYRSLNIEFESINTNRYQKVGVVNYPSHPTVTRITEYKHLTKQKNKYWTTISREEPGKYDKNSKKFNKAFYPIINNSNLKLLDKYLKESKKYKNLYLLGRLANYKYIDMDDAIKNAINLFDEIKKNNQI